MPSFHIKEFFSYLGVYIENWLLTEKLCRSIFAYFFCKTIFVYIVLFLS